MFMFDPRRGAYRRHFARDKMTRAVNDARTAFRKSAQYATGQAKGLVAETRSSIFNHVDASDEKLCARVRSAMGRVVSHPRAIHVAARDGVVTLRGPILSHEIDDLLRVAKSVRGAKSVVNQLEEHREPGEHPALQGGSPRPYRYDVMQQYWSPTTRMAAIVAGSALLVNAIRRHDLIGGFIGGIGIGLLLRAVTNLPAKRLVGIGAGRRAVDVQKTINIKAPAETVFDFWTSYENFPRFMSNVRQVRNLGDGRSHWEVAGPARIRAQWDAQITCYEPNECIAWQSVKGSMIDNAGIIRFQPNEKGGTRVDIRLSYNPPGGALGHFAAKLFGADPKSEMDQDLARVKTTLETGIPARDAAQPIR